MADPLAAPDFELSGQPHDAFFKAVFSDPVPTAALLRGHLLLYAFHTDAELDTESILNRLQQEPASQQVAMTIAQTLIEKGEARGEARGAARGMWIGKIISMQELMGLETDTFDALSGLPVTELEQQYQMLRGEYDVRLNR